MVRGVCGFIGRHLARGSKAQGYWVRGVDVKLPRFGETAADEFAIGDLRDLKFVRVTFDLRGRTHEKELVRRASKKAAA